MSKILIACDPGASGGIAWTKPGVGVVAVPLTGEKEQLSMIAWVIEIVAEAAGIDTGRDVVIGYEEIICYVEQVTGYIAPAKDEEDRVNRQPAHAMFNFGKNVGAAIMAFRMIGAKIIEVPPKTWQGPLVIKKGGDSKTVWKNRLKAIAQRKFPGVKVTLKVSDALLILNYAMQREGVSAALPLATAQTGQGEAHGRKPATRKRVESGVSGAFGGCADCNAAFSSHGNSLCFSCCNARKAAVGQRLFLHDWKGALFVFKPGEKGETILRRATDLDKKQIPPGKPK